MDKKRILIVSRAFYPMIAPRSYRATELAKEFARQGHDVVALIHKREHDYSGFEAQYSTEIRDFVKGKWFEFPKSNNPIAKLFKGILKYFFIFPDIQLVKLVKEALLNEKDYDLVISIAIPFPVHWGVAKAMKRNHLLTKVWVADCGDPFMGNKEQKVRFPFYFHFVEQWFCTKPDYISIPIEEARNAYPRKCRKKIRVIPQGFNFQSNFVKKQVENQFPHFAYAGSLTKGIRDPQSFLEYLSQLNIDFRFTCYTRDISLFDPFRRILGSKLEIKDYIPREELLNELGNMDFLVNFENRERVQSPSKLIDYALVGRPILAVQSNQSEWGTADEFLKGNYTNGFVIPDISKYDIKNVTKQFLSLIK